MPDFNKIHTKLRENMNKTKEFRQSTTPREFSLTKKKSIPESNSTRELKPVEKNLKQFAANS